MTTTKNWCYGAKTPDIEDAVSAAIFAAHKYRNRICELELEKRERHYEILRSLAPEFVVIEKDVNAYEAKLTEARDAIQAERIKQRVKTPVSVRQWTTQATDCKTALKVFRMLLKEAKKNAYGKQDVIAAMQQNSDRHKTDRTEAKKNSGLYWGTEAIVTQSCGSFASGAPPRFKRYEGEGQLAVQLQGGLDCADANRYNTLCYFGEQKGKKRECFIRIASEDGTPVFAKLDVIFHRELPRGKIKWAYLERRKLANHVKWTVRLTIDVVPEQNDHPMPGEVAIHTGWRMQPNGLRAATWLGSDGSKGAVVLPSAHCEDYLRLDNVRSDRDREFNRMIASLRDWMKEHETPEWLQEPKQHMHKWKANARLAKLYWQWLENRFNGDDSILNEINLWRKQDKHWWQHERRLSMRIVKRRKDFYRKFAKQMSDRYGVAIVSPIDAKELSENSNPEDLERDNTLAHRHSKWAAVSDLTSIIREKFPLRCVDVDSKNITRQCVNCGYVNAENKRKTQCKGCGTTYDADDNAVANTLARGEAAIKTGALLALVDAKRLSEEAKAEKLIKMQAANRAARERKNNANKS